MCQHPVNYTESSPKIGGDGRCILRAVKKVFRILGQISKPTGWFTDEALNNSCDSSLGVEPVNVM